MRPRQPPVISPSSCASGEWKAKLQETKESKETFAPDRPAVVVGGSAAGLFTASLLARAGRSVRICERTERLDPSPRTLIVTRRMRELLGPVGERSVVNQINRFELFTDGRSATVPLEEPDLIIERTRLIRGLAEEAQARGVRIELGRKFAGLTATREGIAVSVERATESSGGPAQEKILADVVVGADGAQSNVALAAGWRRQPTVPLVQAIVKLPSGMPPDTVRVWFIPDDTPYFYWLIPEAADRGALGLIGVDGQETRRCLDSFMEKRHFTPLCFQGARIPVYNGWVPVSRKLAGGNVYLVGDAAAQVKVSTVGGVVTGFRGALGVSEAILNRGRSSELRALQRELNLHLLIRRSIHRFKQADYSRLVDWMNDAMRESLSRVNRDEAARVLWHICRNQPRLLLIGLRGLLTRESLAPPGSACLDSSQTT